jgi:hypothetical protein
MGDQGGFCVSENRQEIFVCYGAIDTIHAYKLDRITEDTICFLVSYHDLSDGSLRSLEINEDMPGFGTLAASFLQRLSGFDSHWREKVIKPAFAENRTLIFARQGVRGTERV